MRLGNESRAIANDGNAVDERAIGQRVVGLELDDVEAELAQRANVLVVLLDGLVEVDRLDLEHARARVLASIRGLLQARRHAIHDRVRVLEVERVEHHHHCQQQAQLDHYVVV